MRRTIWSLKQGGKRRGCPSWSCPAEPLLIALEPECSAVGEAQCEGLGADKLGLDGDQFALCKKELEKVMRHTHRAQWAPLDANGTKAFLQQKGNGEKGFKGQGSSMSAATGGKAGTDHMLRADAGNWKRNSKINRPATTTPTFRAEDEKGPGVLRTPLGKDGGTVECRTTMV